MALIAVRSIFNVGAIFAIPPTTQDAVPDPVQFAVVREASFDFSFDVKELRGENVYVEDVVKTNGKLTGKVKVAKINPQVLLATMPGATNSLGSFALAKDETSTIPATPFQVTVTHSADFDADLGVKIAGVPAEAVSGTPTTGQYSFSAGVYTFAAADTGKTVAISYSYTSAAGTTTSVSNLISEATDPYLLRLFNTTRSKVLCVSTQCHFAKLGLGIKLQDFAEHDLDFTIVPDSSGILLKATWSA